MLSSFEEVQKKRIGTPVELRVRAADGSWRLVELIGASTRTDSGLLVVNTIRDLTPGAAGRSRPGNRNASARSSRMRRPS